MNLYELIVAYVQPIRTKVAIIARDQDHALERLNAAIAYKDMPEEFSFRIESVSLVEEDVSVDEENLEEVYSSKDKKRVMN